MDNTKADGNNVKNLTWAAKHSRSVGHIKHRQLGAGGQMRRKQWSALGDRSNKPSNGYTTPRLAVVLFAAACLLRVFHVVDISIILKDDGDVVLLSKLRHENADDASVGEAAAFKVTLKYAYVNFWPGFNESHEHDTFTGGLAKACREHGCRLQAVDSLADADLIVSSSAQPHVDVSKLQAFKVLVAFDNIGADGRGPLRKFDTRGFDYIFGSHDHYTAGKRSVPSVRWPSYIAHACDGFQDGEPPIAAASRCLGRFAGEPLRPLAERNKNATLVARKDAKRGGPAPQFRARILQEFAKAGVQVDCPSAIGKNMPSIEQLYMSKVEFLSQYAFNICPEDSAGPGYVTEKLADAVLSGAIPIYFGSLADEDLQFFNKDRIIFIDPTNIAASVEQVARLQRDERALKRLYARPVLAPSAAHVVASIYRRLYQGLGEVVVATLSRIQVE